MGKGTAQIISKKAKPKLEGEASETKVPLDLRKALNADPKILALWKDITPIAHRDFIRWIESAKQLETRKRRISITIDKLKTGKRRPCCYAVVPMNMYRALGANPKAKAQWSNLSADEKRDFVEWVESVSQPERGIRIAKACMMLAAGKRKP